MCNNFVSSNSELQVQQAGTSGQTQVATLVKTVSAPGSGGSPQSVTIPVTGMTLPQVKATGAMKTATPQQIRQLAIQQQLLQQRKLPPQKMAQLAQVQYTSWVISFCHKIPCYNRASVYVI
jgi:hypothetical protein